MCYVDGKRLYIFIAEIVVIIRRNGSEKPE